MDIENMSEEILTGAGREAEEPPAGYGGQEMEPDETDAAGETGAKSGEKPQTANADQQG